MCIGCAFMNLEFCLYKSGAGFGTNCSCQNCENHDGQLDWLVGRIQWGI